jgi:hypothetical protein
VGCNLLARNRPSDSIVVFEERARRDQARRIPGASHIAIEKKPAAVARALNDFFT